MIKTQEFQQFTTIDSVSVFGLLLLVSFIFISILGGNALDKKISTADAEASRLASSLIGSTVAFYGLPEQQNQLRGIASESARPTLKLENTGRIGLDPWGRAYHYQVMNTPKGRRVAIVLSTGPNMVLETTPESVIADKDGSFVELANQGDDIAAIISR